MELAKIRVNDVCAKIISKKPIPFGIIGSTISFEFDDNWKALNKIIVFKNADKSIDNFCVDNVVTVPQEIVSYTNKELYVGVYGTDIENNIAIPTLWVNLGFVNDSTLPSGNKPNEVSLPIWTKIINMIGDLKYLKTINKENIVASINELFYNISKIKEFPYYYTPSVSQPESNKMQVHFDASYDTLPVLEDILITLPEGMSAYEVAVSLGYKGTEKEWIKSLRYDHSDEFSKLVNNVMEYSDSAKTAELSASQSASYAETAASNAKSSARSAMESANKIITTINDLEIKIIDKVCQPFHEKAPIVQGEFINDYPLNVKTYIEPWQEGSGDPSPTNVRPIHGVTELRLTHCGKNLINLPQFTAKAYNTKLLRQDYESLYTELEMLPEGQYRISSSQEIQMRFDYADGSNVTIRKNNQTGSVKQGVITSIYLYIGRYDGVFPVTATDIQLECSSAYPTTYEPYYGETHTKKLPEEVFNAAFNWGDGTLQLRSKLFTLRIADMNNSENQPGWKQVPGLKDVIGTELSILVKTLCSVGRISTNAKYSILFFNNSGMTQSQWQAQYPDMTVQILVEYLENLRPTIQLPPEPHILALDGATTLYSNAGNTEVIGRSDTGSLITSLSNRIAALEKSKVNI